MSSRRAVRVTDRVSSVLPKGCPSDHPSFERLPEGLSVTPSEGLSDCLPEGCPGADEGVHPRSWEVVNPSCGDLHQRSTSTLLPLRYESETIRSKPCMQSS